MVTLVCSKIIKMRSKMAVLDGIGILPTSRVSGSGSFMVVSDAHKTSAFYNVRDNLKWKKPLRNNDLADSIQVKS